jgi:transcriptional regulator with XRE-family HTH domain
MTNLGRLDTEIGDRISQARKQAGHKQKDFAPLLGISRQTLNRYEMGSRPIPAEILVKTIAITNCDAAWLLMGTRSDQTRAEVISGMQKILSELTAAEEKETYGLTNRDKFWVEVGRHLDQVEGAEHLRRIIYDAFRAAHVPVDEIEKRYRY